MKNKALKLLLVFGLLLLPFGAAKAFDAKTGDSIYVPKDEIISGNLYAAGETATIDGDITGDIIAIAETININGSVGGDIIAIAKTININGSVGGNMRVVGSNITVNGSIARNINLLSDSAIFGPESKVGWDVLAASENMELKGNIEGGLSGNFGHLLLAGKNGKDIDVEIAGDGLLTVSPEAEIAGAIIYRAEKTAEISTEAKINGAVKQAGQKVPEKISFSAWVWPELYSIFGALAVGLALVFLGKNLTPNILKKVEKDPLRCSIYGLILFVSLPLAAFILLFSIIGIPLALITLAVWFMGIYIGKVFAAILIGSLILKNINKKNNPKLIWSLILGVVICWLLFAIPYIGWVIGLFAAWVGLGGTFAYATNKSKHL